MARLAYEVNVVHIHFGRDISNWSRNSKRNNGKNGQDDKKAPTNLPSEIIVELPKDFNERFRNRSNTDYMDAIESYVYNYLTKRYRKECVHCQIWIGDDLEVALKRIEEAKRRRADIGAVDITDRPDDDDEYDEEDQE